MEAVAAFALTIALLGGVFGFVGVRGCIAANEDQNARMHPKNFIAAPYCETAKIQDQEYKRCWKAEEIK